MQYDRAWRRSSAFQREPGRSQLQTGPAPARRVHSGRRLPRSRRQGQWKESFQARFAFLSFAPLILSTPTTDPQPFPLLHDGGEEKDGDRVEMRVSQGARKEPTGAYTV